MRVAVLLLALTAALSIWPCAAAPRSLEPEHVRIANAADARLVKTPSSSQELTPPQAMPPSGSSYQNKCRSQRMRFGTQNLRGFRDKAKMQEVRCNMTDRGTAILALQETWHRLPLPGTRAHGRPDVGGLPCAGRCPGAREAGAHRVPVAACTCLPVCP